jgi:hypothetical protein
MKTSKKLKPMKANVGKFLLSKALDPKAGKSSKAFFESIGKFPFVERRMKLSGSTGSKAKMLGAGAVGAGAIAGTNEAIKDYSELSQSEEFKKGREKGAEKSKKFKERAKEVIGETVGKITGKRMGGAAIKARDGVEIETSKRKNLREAAEGARAGGASEATLKYFLDNAKRTPKERTRLTPRDYELMKKLGENSRTRKLHNEGFSDAEISAMGKKAGGSAIKGKGAVARDRGMGLQDENISVGKGADYIKDLIS